MAFSPFGVLDLAGFGVEEAAARRDAEGRLRPPPSVAALLIGPAAAAATGPTVRPPTGCRHRRSGGPGEAGGAGASGSWQRPGECFAEGRCPPGLGGLLVVAPSPEKTGIWVSFLRELSAALELGRLNLGGEVTCSDSARVLLAEAETQPWTFNFHTCALLPSPNPPLALASLGAACQVRCALSCTY